jgi:hypothetical protein
LPQSFTNKKSLKFVITLGTGKFGSSNNNQVTLQGLRAIIDIDKAGGVQMSTLRAKIYGVSQSDMNSCVSLQFQSDTYLKNSIQVTAIDGTSQTLVYNGTIVNAWGDYKAMPDVFLYIQAGTGIPGILQPVPPTSFKGAVDVASAMAQLASNLGYTFENNGVTGQLSDVYLANTGLEQIKDLAKAIGCDWGLDDNNVLWIAPRNTPRGGLIPLISKDTGMIGYPTFDKNGVNFDTLFNPAIRFHGAFKIVTDIPQAAGQWIAYSIAHRLESERPGGAWFSSIRGDKTGTSISK